ncbi:MAG: iron ABC transporter permease [Planctomycetales bacterium]|nr:iron ABC transporter permease [Planctomycetales bacterium]
MTRASSMRPAAQLTLMLLALGSVVAVSLSLGTTDLSFAQVVRALTGRGEGTENLVVLQLRLPRIVIGALVGAGFSVAGVLLQGLSRNDLASPSTVGVEAGSGLGMMLALVLVPLAAARQTWVLPAASAGGALMSTLLVFGLASRRGRVLPARLLLIGIAVSYGASAATLLLSLRMDFVTHSRVIAWMSGSLSGGSWGTIRWFAPFCTALILAAYAQARSLNVIALGDGPATSLGVRVERQRFAALTLATIITSACAALAGQIGFLGLVAPHLARRLVGVEHRVLIPAAALTGAALLVTADALGRRLFSPVEIPAGVLVGILGGSYFLYLLARTKG